ncbi:MAG: hypothetical protein KBG09_04730 [Syntrophobacterales bacterium]|nr:hypothetical protein [Syntrophobacterales bacterium]
MKSWLALFFCVLFMGAASSLAIEQTDPYQAKSTAVKSVPINPAPQKAPPRETRMRATGRVIEISAVALKIERNVKGTVETMEFILAKPQDKINVGDEVGVSYITKDGQHIAKRIVKVTKKKVVTPKGGKSSVPTPPAK